MGYTQLARVCQIPALCAMHILKVQHHFLDVIDKVSNPALAKPCHYSNSVMRLPLREKIQNAINRAIADSQGYPATLGYSPHHDQNNNKGVDGALIVGGRRRNRKKKNRKNGQKEKKKSKSPRESIEGIKVKLSPSLESIKSKLSPSGVRKGGNHQDVTPLITPVENKTEAAPVEAKPEAPKEETPAPEEAKNDVTTPPVAEEKMKEDSSKEETNGTVTITKEELKEASNKENGKTLPASTTTAKSEKSPLIDKLNTESISVEDGEPEGRKSESKLKDGAPGMLCCTIL